MDKKVARVFQGYLGLDSSQRAEFERLVDEFKRAPDDRRRRLRETARDAVFKLETGPLSGGTCPCCGR